jgi:predicted phage baseplate assembly protein
VPLRLLFNLVPVSRGTTVTGEVLGSGNAALAGQSFTLSKFPLTYLHGDGGPVSTLTVTVNQIQWREVPSFYGQAASARVFVVTRSPDQTVTTVTFGDGVNGARLPSGTGNVMASYRYGSGAVKPRAGLLTTINQPQPNLASIQNPVAVSGGTDPEAPGDVRSAAPASVTTLGRAISATDYAAIAAQAPGVDRAAAAWTFDPAGQRTLVTVYVSDDEAAVTAASAALAGIEGPNRKVAVAAAAAIGLTLSCRLVLAAGQQAHDRVTAAKAAIGDLFSPAHMGIGQPLYRSAVDAALLVPGVIAVHHLQVTTGDQNLGEVLGPGTGAYFDLPDLSGIEAVSADG